MGVHPWSTQTGGGGWAERFRRFGRLNPVHVRCTGGRRAAKRETSCMSGPVAWRSWRASAHPSSAAPGACPPKQRRPLLRLSDQNPRQGQPGTATLGVLPFRESASGGLDNPFCGRRRTDRSRARSIAQPRSAGGAMSTPAPGRTDRDIWAEAARVSKDGRRIVVQFEGSRPGPGPCGVSYQAAVATSGQSSLDSHGRTSAARSTTTAGSPAGSGVHLHGGWVGVGAGRSERSIRDVTPGSWQLGAVGSPTRH